jgi:uncharacterized protein YbaR (Trm112 family)
MLNPDLLAILRCPKCRGTLNERSAPPSLLCASCHLVYAIEEGIPNLLLEEAEAVAAAAAEAP